jgi:hypothetical protein
MVFLTRFIILVGALLACSALAHTPPWVPPDPDPVRLAAAERLVAALPLENGLRVGFYDEKITADVANDALAWLGTNQFEQKDETIERIFYLKVRSESRAQLASAIGDARRSLAGGYALQLSERELEAAQTFAVTPEGKAFLEVQLRQDIGMHKLVSRFLYDRTFSELPRILKSARESSQILERVNRMP